MEEQELKETHYLINNIGYEPRSRYLVNGELQFGSPAINQGENIEWLLIILIQLMD